MLLNIELPESQSKNKKLTWLNQKQCKSNLRTEKINRRLLQSKNKEINIKEKLSAITENNSKL